MQALRQFVFSNLPVSFLTSFLQLLFSMPVQTARYLLADLISPKPDQQEWIKMIEKPGWKGAWIGESMSMIEDEEQLNQRIKDADIIIFKAHGTPK
jgi:hypothetical protein